MAFALYVRMYTIIFHYINASYVCAGINGRNPQVATTSSGPYVSRLNVQKHVNTHDFIYFSSYYPIYMPLALNPK